MSTQDEAPPTSEPTPGRELPDGADPAAVLARRREAVAELGDALRELAVGVIETEIDDEVVREVAADARRLASRLSERRRRPGQPSSDEVLRRGERLFNPIVGVGNPVAPPMRVELVDGAAVGWCTLDGRYEGPPTYAHGGVSAMLLDQIMGHAAAAADHPGVTARLEVRYRAAVPLGTPLRLHAQLIDVLGVRAAIRGSISLADAPDDALVEAEGRFLALRPEQAARLFGETAAPDG